MGEELNVSIRREKLLTAMGIQVWYPRGQKAVEKPQESVQQTRTTPPAAKPTAERAAAQVERVPEPTAPSEPEKIEVAQSEQQQTIEFVWWRGQLGMMLLEPMQSLDEKLLHDLVVAMDWRANVQVGKVANGHFRWPQLATSSGNPDRAMSAFFDTNGPESLTWLLVSQSMIGDIEPWLPKSAELNSLPDTLHLAEQKKALWQSLAK